MKQKTSLAKIVDTAYHLFLEKGFDNVSVMDICRAAGITKPTFYKFAVSKESLLLQFYLGADATVVREMKELDAQGNYIEEIWTGTSCMMKRSRQLGHDLYSHFIIYCLRAHTHPNIAGNYLHDEICAAIEKAQETGQIRNMTDPDFIWLSLINMVLGTGCQWAFSAGEDDVLALCRHRFEIIVRPSLSVTLHPEVLQDQSVEYQTV